jgi:nicotinamide-nucleotide amidase
MKVEVINTGTELLLGTTLNTHLSFIAQELFALGLRIDRQTTVSDGDDIRVALLESLPRAEIIFVTGGLGPTTDDITREITAELLELPLLPDFTVLAHIKARFERRNLTLTERVYRQAQVPRGAEVLQNANGTAPGLYLTAIWEGRKVHLFLLPGPPRELKPMVRDQVIPILKRIAPQETSHQLRTYHILGVGESNVEDLIGEELLAITGMELGYCARPGAVDIRCIGTPEMLEQAGAIIKGKLAANLVSEDDRSVEQVVVEHLIQSGAKLAIAESCTGGFISNRITNVPGASEVFLAGFVTYSNESKSRELGVPAELIAAHGAVSQEVAAAMAEGALRVSDADYAISTTGIAGPGGGSEAKPVGTVFTALARKGGPTKVRKLFYPTDRETFKSQVAQTALDQLRQAILR